MTLKPQLVFSATQSANLNIIQAKLHLENLSLIIVRIDREFDLHARTTFGHGHVHINPNIPTSQHT